MIRLIVPVIDTLEKARPGLIYRTDLPYHKANGSIGYRRGWVKPEDAKAIDRAKKKGEAASVAGKYKYEEDLFDNAEGESWAGHEVPKNEEKKPESVPAAIGFDRPKEIVVEQEKSELKGPKVIPFLLMLRKMDLLYSSGFRDKHQKMLAESAREDIKKLEAGQISDNMQNVLNGKAQSYQNEYDSYFVGYGRFNPNGDPKYIALMDEYAANTGDFAYEDTVNSNIGDTITKNGVTYRLNENHRWERQEKTSGPLRMTREEYNKKPADYRSMTDGKPYLLALGPSGTTLFPVEFTDENSVGRLSSVQESVKSKGHLGFFQGPAGLKEVYQAASGDIYTAQEDDALDTQTGNRIGRWEGYARDKDAILARMGLAAEPAAATPDITVEKAGKNMPAAVKKDGKTVGSITQRVTASKSGEARVEFVARDAAGNQLSVAPSRDKAMEAFGAASSAEKPAEPSRVADRIAKPEVADGAEPKGIDVQADLEKPIAKTKFSDYGSWSASGKHITPAKRAAVNQQIAELIMNPSDELDKKELELIRQYSGFGGVKAEDERGVQYDYFTSPPVARMVWKLANKIMPFKVGSRMLEPSCGTGVFFDVAPQGVDLTGVEFDSRTATVAGLLQPQARVYHSSFEQFNLHQREQFDAVIGNAPFGDRSVATQFMDDPEEKSLDRYFISRSLDNLKAGGMMSLIVAPGVMDNVTNKEWRAKMLRKGQFIGAVRLPNESFKHTNTGVSPDVVMFRAYPDDIRDRLALMSDDEMRNAGFWDDSWVDGSYYDEMPTHRLGRIARGNFDTEITVGKLEPADMDRAFDQFQPRKFLTGEDFGKVRTLTQGRQAPAARETEKLSESEAAAVAAKTLRVGMTKTVDGKVYRLNANHRWELMDTSAGVAAKIDRVKEISETVRAIREAMRADEPVDDLQRQARALMEAYQTEFGVSHADDKDVERFIKANPALAGVYEALTTRLDSELLTKQNVYEKEIQIVDGHRPAIRALMEMQRDLADATMDSIKKRYPNEADGLIEAMWSDPDVFVDESGVFHLREDFISGNAWDKIDALEKAISDHTDNQWARNREKWQAGASALRDAIGWVPIEEADVFPQASWIPEDFINKWAVEFGSQPPKGYKWGRNEEGKWGIVSLSDMAEWSWKKRASIERFEGEWDEYNDEFVYFLNMQKQRSKYTDTNTYNQNAIESFKAWLSTDDEARKEIENLFNRKFNTELGVPTKTYAVNIDGWSDRRVIQPWQWQSIHHLYRQGKGISALGTGFGKTDAAVALMGLLRQEGKIKRPMFQVPNNKVKDWVRHISEDMPGLKIGSVDPERAGYGNRETRYKWYQELASGDYDVIILPETSASEIQLTSKNDDDIVKDIASQFSANKGKTDKKKEEAKASAEDKLTGGKKNLTINFEDFGCDAMFCDECFPYETNVKTDRGDMMIGEIVEKKLEVRVLSCDTSTGILEFKRVIRKIPRQLHHKVLKVNYEGGYLVCTDSHKIWTVENGYQRADRIKSGETLKILRAGGEVVRMVRPDVQLQVFGAGKQQEATVLQRIMRGLLSIFTSSYQRAKKGSRLRDVGCDQGKAGPETFGENEVEQSDSKSRFRGKNATFATGTDVPLKGRERAAYEAANDAFGGAGASDGVSDSDASGKRDVSFSSNLLQSGLGNTGAENSHRGGWKFAQALEVEIPGREKDGNLECVRVESVEVLERGDFVRYGFRDSEDSTVYDIEVEDNHNFFADGILVSNCHNYKNLFTSSLSRETGMNDGRRSDRALAFFKKCEHIRRTHGGKNVYLLTATPLTNSPLEYYNMMQHVSPEELSKLNVSNIDDFIRNFADIEEGQKYDSFSGQLKPGKVLTGFKNLRALQDMFFKFTDLQDDPTKIGLKKPTPTNKPNILPDQEDQTAEVQALAAEVEKYRKMTKEERAGLTENFLTYYSKMRTASLDLELYDPERFKNWKNPKLEKMAESAMATYQARGGGQVVFCDRVLSSDGSVNMHDKIKKSLVDRGFKENEVVIVNGLTKSGAKSSDSALEKEVSAAIEGFNSGKYKVIIGTTQTIGEGVNLQRNSSALHHVDIPYRPSDFIQRNGRVDRQGNKQSSVELHTYATAGTIDNYSMALVAGKENWINQLLKTKSNVFTNPNGDGMDMDEILLALTEEWGNKKDAAERRQAIADKKAAAIKVENEKKAHDYLKQLSLMRGSLSTYKGDKGSRDYQNRLRKIDNLEAGLRNNPEFKNPELLEDDPKPFIYDESKRRVIHLGDIVISGGAMSRVSGFDYKDREYSLSSLITGEHVSTERAYASDRSYGYSRGDEKVFIHNPSEQEVERYKKLLDPKTFLEQSSEFKRDNYDEFMKIQGDGRGSDRPHPIVEQEDGRVMPTYYVMENAKTINPYSEEGKKKIVDALRSGKMKPSEYESIVEKHGPMGGEQFIRDAKLKNFNENEYAESSLKAFDTVKKDADGWANITKMADMVGASKYDIKSLMEDHPDFEVDMIRGDKGYEYHARRKPGMSKSVHNGKLVAQGGRLYVLHERGR